MSYDIPLVKLLYVRFCGLFKYKKRFWSILCESDVAVKMEVELLQIWGTIILRTAQLAAYPEGNRTRANLILDSAAKDVTPFHGRRQP